MEDKLRNYIKNQFTVKEQIENSEYIKEITANIIERYNDELMNGSSKENAYIKCIDTLENVRTGANIESSIKHEKTYPFSMYISIFLTIASLVVFFFNAFWGLVILCLNVVVFNLELRNQIYNAKTNKLSFAKILLKLHKYLIIAWSFIFSIIILETIFNFSLITEDYIKFTFDMYYNSEPVAIIFLFNLIIMAIIFIPLSIYHNRIVDGYKKYEEVNPKLKHRICINNKNINFNTYKNREFVIYLILVFVGLIFIFFSKVQLYLLGYDPIAEEILGLQLAGSYTFLNFAVSESSKSWPSVIMFITLGLFILYLIVSIFIKRIRQAKYIRWWNIIFTASLLLVFLIQAFFTGVNYTFGITLSFGLGLLIITNVFKSMFRNIEVLNYE